MRHHIMFASFCAILPLLSACNKEPEVSVENATAGEVAKEVAQAGGAGSFVSPGRWESTLTFLEMTMPGMGPEAAAQMKGMTGKTQTHVSCLTPEQAKRPKEDFFAGMDKSCKYDRFKMSGGKIDAVMNCSEQGSTQLMEMAGTYSANAYAMTMKATASGKGPDAGMTMRMRIDAKRAGACDGTEEKE
jgi:hypothetical protein